MIDALPWPWKINYTILFGTVHILIHTNQVLPWRKPVSLSVLYSESAKDTSLYLKFISHTSHCLLLAYIVPMCNKCLQTYFLLDFVCHMREIFSPRSIAYRKEYSISMKHHKMTQGVLMGLWQKSLASPCSVVLGPCLRHYHTKAKTIYNIFINLHPLINMPYGNFHPNCCMSTLNSQ